jgi:hypothetical protein
MKTFQFLTSIVLASMLISCGGQTSNSGAANDSTSVASQEQAAAAPSIKKYPIKSGIITFDNDLMGIKQKSVLYFDDYGMKEADEKYDGDAVKEITICDGQKRYTANFASKVAYEAGDCYRGIAYRFDWDEISKADQQYKVKKGANMTIAGKDCESYSMEGTDYPSTFAGWNNICLYQETRSKFGTATIKAVKVEEVDVPAEKFQVPAGFELKKQ